MSSFTPHTINVGTGGASKAVVALVIVFVIGLLLFMSMAYVPPGHVGVLVYFGRVTGETLPAGTHFVSPFKINHVFSVRTQTQEEHTSTPSSEGLNLEIDTSLIYHLDQSRAADVYSSLGPDYARTIIDPNLRSTIRDTTAGHSANTLYSSQRKQVEDEIKAGLKATLEPRGIMVENVLLRDIQLPHALKASIETKQQAEQESLAMNFRLQKERQEADRKRIEAQGIHDFQAIVSQGISAQLLAWKGIEATETLAKSPNSKIIIIGNSKNGLPLVLSPQ
ncbi:MAG TPA: prohibitin family protein [Alphaproteobacteria bacterium]|nr:prohibitin family protein [Alphaproteobacteria bacterium]